MIDVDPLRLVNAKVYTEAELSQAVQQAIKDERDRAAGIVEAGAMLASADGVIPASDPEHERLERLATILRSAAAAIRHSDTREGS